jgi:hypothetical protein
VAHKGPSGKQEWSVAPMLLEVTSAQAIQTSRQRVNDLLRFYWNLYWELALQRRGIQTQLDETLRLAAAPFAFSGWQRAVKYRHSLHPLCSLGSLGDPGGRFNIGDIDKANFPTFSALYLAQDKETALQEMFGRDDPKTGLSRLDFALTTPDSLSIVSVNGSIEAAIDLRTAASLESFVSFIKRFKLPSALQKDAKRLKQSTRLARSPGELLESLMSKDWRQTPMQVDIPAAGQIFGHLAYAAGVDAIVYQSVLTGGHCAAIFPAALANSSGFITLSDAPPDRRVVTRVDSSNWDVCEKPFESLHSQTPAAE